MFQAPLPALQPQQYNSKPKKMAAVLGVFFLVVFAIVGLIVMLSFIGSMANGEADAIGGVAIGLGILLVTGFGAYKLFLIAQRPVNYTPRFPPVPGYVLGQPFDVRLVRKTMGSSFRGDGVVQFFGDHLIVDGQREIPLYIQIGIMLVLLVGIFYLTGVPYGLIPVALLVTLISRKKLVHPVPYYALRSAALNGGQVSFTCAGVSPGTISFYVSSYDYERVANEVQQRFPAMLAPARVA